MAFGKALGHLESLGFADRVKTFDVSSATVELAAEAVGTDPARIVKSLTFMVEDLPIMVLCAGDVKVNSSKFKQVFHAKPKMIDRKMVEGLIGHDVGGVCPFGINVGVSVYLDESIKRFDLVYPACGNAQSAVELSVSELEVASGYTAWVDVCR